MERNKNSVGSVVKSFDIFRKLPSDVTSGTQSGAVSNNGLFSFDIFSMFFTFSVYQ
jgi:hypothetical protein